MSWIIHKNQRKVIYNSNQCKSIIIKQHTIILDFSDECVTLHYDSEQEAKQSFGYIIEAIRRDDKVVNI